MVSLSSWSITLTHAVVSGLIVMTRAMPTISRVVWDFDGVWGIQASKKCDFELSWVGLGTTGVGFGVVESDFGMAWRSTQHS